MKLLSFENESSVFRFDAWVIGSKLPDQESFGLVYLLSSNMHITDDQLNGIFSPPHVHIYNNVETIPEFTV